MNNKPLEIEYKFLIEMPDIEILRAQPAFRELNMVQTYLSLPEGFSPHGTKGRVRKTTENGKTVYHENFKTTVTALTRIEIENEIDEAKYREMCTFAEKETSPVEKVRYCFDFEGYTYEIDIFPFWKDKAYMEIEVESEDVLPPVPPFIKVIKDVSADRRYRNTSIARMLFCGKIDI